ncbi:MAG: hypothetical protein LW714_08195 [Oxalobacteraceae bacterium]|jgi:hypothetical protein|nr:hypothetical protein [Oxalobacteraceae bacterium]
MWKILVAFILFAAIALTVVFKMGDKVDMQGEAGGHTETSEQHAPTAPAAATTAPAEAPAAAMPATPTAEEKK